MISHQLFSSKSVAGFLTVGIVATTTACGNPQNNARLAASELTYSPAKASAPTASRTDEEITTAVHSALQAVPNLAAQTITVESYNGQVTLSGVSHTLIAKEQAADVTARIQGVRQINNQLMIQPDRREDALITADVVDALTDKSRTKRSQISVKTHDGVVQLMGAVGSQQNKQVATEVAQTIRGVKDVQNTLLVRSNEPHSEQEG
jgi:hyperosmotically inducible protein